MASNLRIERIGDEIQKICVALLATQIRDPRLHLISITGVKVSQDLSYAKIFFSSQKADFSPAEIAKVLEKAKGFFRTGIAKNLRLRIVPQLAFFYDHSLDYGSKIDFLIEKIRQSDKNIS